MQYLTTTTVQGYKIRCFGTLLEPYYLIADIPFITPQEVQQLTAAEMSIQGTVATGAGLDRVACKNAHVAKLLFTCLRVRKLTMAPQLLSMFSALNDHVYWIRMFADGEDEYVSIDDMIFAAGIARVIDPSKVKTFRDGDNLVACVTFHDVLERESVTTPGTSVAELMDWIRATYRPKSAALPVAKMTDPILLEIEKLKVVQLELINEGKRLDAVANGAVDNTPLTFEGTYQAAKRWIRVDPPTHNEEFLVYYERYHAANRYYLHKTAFSLIAIDEGCNFRPWP